MSLTVKVIFECANGSNEIRRFPVNTSSADLFTSTKEKIKQLYPALAHGNFTLFWQDPDGDRVAFSSSEEMREALVYATDNVLRVYVSEPKENAKKSNQGQQQQKPTAEQQGHSRSQTQSPRPNRGQGQGAFKDGPVHVGVTCNGCKGPVIGIRYKCCVCPGYNLCQSCKSEGLHAEHDMLRINHPHFVLPPHPSVFFDKFTQGMAPGACGSASFTCNGTGSCRTNASTSRGADFQDGASSQQEDNKNEQFNFQECLSDFGANISAFLDPFGIKVSYNFRDGNGNRQQENYHHNWRMGGRCPAWDDMHHGAQQTESDKPGATEHATEKMGTGSRNPKNGSTAAPKEDVRKADHESKESSSSPDDWTYLKEDGSELRIPSSVAIPMPAPPSKSVSAPICDPQPPAGTASPPRPTTTPQPPARSAPPPRPTVAPRFPGGPPPTPRPTTGTQTTTSPGSASPSESPSEESSDQRVPLNQAIQQSLDQMLAMGFADSDGWLTALLTEYEGDIGATLDAIKVKATQQLENLHGIQ